MVSVLDLDFTTLLSSSFSDFSPSGSSDTDTIFSSPSHTHNFDFQNFTIENAFADIPSWEPSVPESDAFSDPESAIVVKQEPTEDTVSLPSQSVLSESLENTFVKPEPDTAVHTTSRPQRKPRAKRRKVDSHKEVSTVSSSSHHTTSEPRLILSREELLTLTSSQYEAIIAQVRTSRELTAAEKRDVKRQRRLIKNRESAQASRQRKKTYVEELERRLAEVSSENTLLRQTSLIVQNENALLRAENEYIKGVLNNSGLSSVLNRGANAVAEHIHKNQLTTSAQTPPPPHKVSPLKSSGAVLLVLLFSFGLMFGNIGFPNPGTDSFATEAVPEVLPGRMFQRKEYQPVSNSHSATEILEEEDMPLKQRLSKQLGAVEEATQKVGTVADLSADLDPSFWKPNTTYLMCGDIHQLTPPEMQATTDSQETNISFLIPPSTLGDSMEDMENVLLAVSCKVTDVVMVPLKSTM